MNKEKILGNYYNKYTSNNFFSKLFIRKYRIAFQNYLKLLDVNNVLEVGSGEGYLLRYVKEINPILNLYASDIDWKFVKTSRQNFSKAHWTVCLGEALPFDSQTFDLVLACEVLEHVSMPSIFLEELRRVGKKWLIASVPNEPWWRLLNIARLKYIKNFGNTPGHVQHWNISDFSKLITNYIEPYEIRSVFPWIFAIGKFKRN